MANDKLWINPDGSYTRRTTKGTWTVPVGDPRYERMQAEYNRRYPSVRTYNPVTGAYTNTVNGKDYTVYQGDPRYQDQRNLYAAQNGGIGGMGTVDNPVGYEKVKSIQDASYYEQRNAAQQQIDAAVKALQDSIINANQTYDQAAKEQYAAKRIAEKNMGQALAAQGLSNTGVAETTALGNETNYLNNLNQNEVAREQAVRAIQSQIAQTQAAGAGTLAEIGANYSNNLTNAFTTLLGQNMNQWNADRDYALNRQQMNWQQQQAEQQAEREWRLNQLAQLINLGFITPEPASYWGIPSSYYNLYNQASTSALKKAAK